MSGIPTIDIDIFQARHEGLSFGIQRSGSRDLLFVCCGAKIHEVIVIPFLGRSHGYYPMSRVLRIITIGSVAACGVASVFSLRTDIAQTCFSQIWRSWNWLLLAMALTFINYTLRIVRWRWLMALSGHHVSPLFAALTYIAGFAFTLSPGKLGELMKARYYTAVNISLPDVITAFAVERLMDMLALLALSFLIWDQLPQYRGLLYLAGAAVTVGCALLVTFLSDTAMHGLKSLLRFSPRLSRAGALLMNSLIAARFMLNGRTISISLLIAVLAWSFEGLELGVLVSVFSPSQGELGTYIGIYAVSVLLGAISFVPGGVGGTEAVMTALLVSQGATLPSAIVSTLACRITTLWLGILLGWAAVATLRNRPQPDTHPHAVTKV